MSVTEVEERIYMIDTLVAGLKNSVASYVLKGESIAIVEAGPPSSVENVICGLKELGIKPEAVSYIAISHIHLDHYGGVGTLVKFLPRAKVIVHQRGAPHLANPEKLWQQARRALGETAEIYGKPEPVLMERIIVAQNGMTLDIGSGIVLKVVETLGHASHHLSYYESSSNGIFTGDAAGIYLNEIDAIVPTTPPPFRLEIALQSLEKLKRLKPSVLYYTHFGKANKAVERLQTYARQLSLWADVAKQALTTGKNLEWTSRKIAEMDEAIKRAEEYIEKHRFLKELVLRMSVQGFLDYVKTLKMQ